MLGRVDPYAMLAQMDVWLFDRWRDYFAAEPFGPGVEAWLLSRLAAYQLATATGERPDVDGHLPRVTDDDDDDGPGNVER